VNKTAKQRLSQSEIDSLVQQASVKKQLGSGPGLPAPRPQKQEVKPALDSKRQSEAVAAPAEAAVPKTENQRQTPVKTPEQARSQQTQSAPAAKKEDAQPQPAAKSAETPARSEDNHNQDEKPAAVVVVSSSASAQRSPLELKQYFWLGGEGTSDLRPDRVMTVLNKKLSRLG
jgi:hypothetical protein